MTLILALYSPAVQAAAPGQPGNEPTTTDTHTYQPHQDAHWLYLKLHHQIRSGVTPKTKKGDKTTTSIAPTPDVVGGGGGGTPNYYTLPYWSKVYNVYEPSTGVNSNFGAGTASTDDNNRSYYDSDFWDLCGPGAADIALEYWPAPPNLIASQNIADTNLHNGTVTTWLGERMRGYMTYLAWQTNWPYWANTPWHTSGNDPIGMMDNHYYPSKGVTLYGMEAALNWEASGKNTSNWQGYFYTIAWWNQHSQNDLHNDIVDDIYNNNVPVVAEVDPTYFNANWDPKYRPVHHFITIIGYNDTNHTYQYTDSCGASTGCNPSSGNTDNTTYYNVDQSLMWQGIISINVNQSTDPTAGDGGWVW